jgi:hypothetical protein
VHPLTKVLVALAALLSIAVAAFTIAYTANADRVRSELLNERELARTAQDMAAKDKAAHAAEKAGWEQEKDALGRQVAEMDTRVSSLMQDNARLLADVKTREAEGLSAQAKIDQLSATNQTLSSLIAKYRDEVTGLRQAELGYARREIELSDRASDLQGQLEVAVESNRALQEQLVDARDQLQAGRSGGTAARAGEGTLKASFPVRARVSSVRRDPSGDVLVQIEAGSSDQLRERMELSLVRGSALLGKVVLQTVDINESVGKVDFLGRPAVEVREGDMVMSLVQ